MFKLTRPCVTCPFRKGQGPLFMMDEERVREIVEQPSFQCHKTVDYETWEDPIGRQGKHPQQCAGLMSLLHRAGKPNQIMQVGERLGEFDPSKLRHDEVYKSLSGAIRAHGRRGGRCPRR